MKKSKRKQRINTKCQHDWAYNEAYMPTLRECRLCGRVENRAIVPLSSIYGPSCLSYYFGDWVLLTEDIDYGKGGEKMNHAEKCPVCGGSGELSENEEIRGTGKSRNFVYVCHGCNGKGWVVVPDDCVCVDEKKWLNEIKRVEVKDE